MTSIDLFLTLVFWVEFFVITYLVVRLVTEYYSSDGEGRNEKT